MEKPLWAFMGCGPLAVTWFQYLISPYPNSRVGYNNLVISHIKYSVDLIFTKCVLEKKII